MAKILIVEDEIALAKNLQLAFKDKHEVIMSASGEEGLEKAKTEKPDVMLLDIMLPDKNGLEVLKELKDDPETEKINIIISTNLADSETVSKILAAGGRDYIVKTDWRIDEIVEKVESFL